MSVIQSKRAYNMAEEKEESTWILELEGALMENCSAGRVHEICKGKPFPDSIRTEAWQACLGIQNKKDQLTNFNEIYDLPEQETLREDCRNVVEKLGNDDCDKVSVVSYLESILTHYCKSNNLRYERDNGWIELLLPILALKNPKSDTYNIFEAVVNRYLPKAALANDTYSLLRLLILYHDPKLCSFLDTKKATPDLYAAAWFRNLFSGTCYLKVVHFIWDYYFQQNNPFLIFFLSLVFVLNWREQMNSFKGETRDKIVESIAAMPSGLIATDVSDFCSLAQYFALKTPKSFKKELFDVFFGSSDDSDCSFLKQPLSQTLCLPVSTSELVENVSENELFDYVDEPIERVRFFLVDCRPAEQYNAGHLPTAFHLDSNLMLQEPSAFNVAVQGLFTAQKQSIAANSRAGGKHLCFLGSGRDDEDQYTHMVVASFLQKNTQYISMLTGGYQAIHDYFGSDMLDCLEDHDSKKCIVCSKCSATSKEEVSNGTQSSKQFEGQDLFGKISEVVKTKSADFKEKLREFIVNPSASGDGGRHVSPRDKVGKLYRNLVPVFSIDDENVPDTLYYGEEEEEEMTQEIVSLSDYLKSDKTKAYFQCHEVKENGYMYESYLLIHENQLIVLRELSKRKGCALLVVKRPLSTIAQITCRKKYPNLITFKYGRPDGEDNVIYDMDSIPVLGENSVSKNDKAFLPVHNEPKPKMSTAGQNSGKKHLAILGRGVFAQNEDILTVRG